MAYKRTIFTVDVRVSDVNSDITHAIRVERWTAAEGTTRTTEYANGVDEAAGVLQRLLRAEGLDEALAMVRDP
jgi:hypothetical protein